MPEPVPYRRLRDACARVLDDVQASPRYAHTSHLLVEVAGERIFDVHLRGPERADVFSVTKTVLATVVGCAVHEGRLPALDDPIADVLPVVGGTPSESHTWRQLLTMTRGSRTDGPWDVDAVTAMPGGLVRHIALAPSLDPPGAVFRYDNASSHLLSAALAAVVGESVAAYAQRVLFDPLHIDRPTWLADPDGVTFGFGHLVLSAADLARLGTLWLDHGCYDGTVLVDPGFAADMVRAQRPGGPPEGLAYGYLTWVDEHSILAGGWAGQHVLVVPDARAVIVTTGDPRFVFGPPPSDELPPDWSPALDLVRRHLLPLLTQ